MGGEKEEEEELRLIWDLDRSIKRVVGNESSDNGSYTDEE